MPPFPLDATPAPVNTCPMYVALLLVVVAALGVVVVVFVGSAPPIPLQIKLPTFACAAVVCADVDVGVELAGLCTVVIASVMVELPTTRKALFGARLTGVSRIVTAELPGVRVVPAMTIGLDGSTTTGRL